MLTYASYAYCVYLEIVRSLIYAVLPGIGFDTWISVLSAEQEGIKANPIEVSQFVDFVKQNKLQIESFFLGPSQCEFCDY